jgi:hypothetical protein
MKKATARKASEPLLRSLREGIGPQQTAQPSKIAETAPPRTFAPAARPAP